MANQLDNFDKLIKDSYEDFEAPYDASHWEELEEELNTMAPGLNSYFSAVTTGLVATGIVFISMLFFFSDNYSNGQIDQSEDIANEMDADNGNAAVLLYENDDIHDESGANSDRDDAEMNDHANESDLARSSVQEQANGTSSTEKQTQIAGTAIKVSSKTNKMKSDAALASKSGSKVRTGCTGLVIDFNSTEDYGNDAKYLWNFGDGFFSNEANPSHTFNKEGTFDVSLSVTSPSSGQIRSNIVQAMIEVVEAPIASLDVNIEAPNSIKLINNSQNSNEIGWNIDGESHSGMASVALSLADNTRYEVRLSATNENGCSDTIQNTIKTVNAGSEFPRAFENVSGHLFSPGAMIDSGLVQSVKIFEKQTGTLVFESFGKKGWNGNVSSGTAANKGSYLWVMVVDKNDSTDIYRGDLEVR